MSPNRNGDVLTEFVREGYKCRDTFLLKNYFIVNFPQKTTPQNLTFFGLNLTYIGKKTQKT